MSTTSLFVELIVSGVGTVAWLLLLVFSIFDYSWILGQKITDLLTLIPFLALVYVLGLIVDHLAHHLYKRLFYKLDRRIRRQSFDKYENYENIEIDEEYLAALKVYVYTHASGNVMERFEYDRSRLRIARAWGVNFVLLAISILIFVWTKLLQVDISTKVMISVFSIIFCGLGAVAAFYTWKDLTKWEYDQLRRINDLVKAENPKVQ